ncbi:MAG: hypothetical protein WC205_04065 [Opitutaceae bacterium]
MTHLLRLELRQRPHQRGRMTPPPMTRREIPELARMAMQGWSSRRATAFYGRTPDDLWALLATLEAADSLAERFRANDRSQAPGSDHATSPTSSPP